MTQVLTLLSLTISPLDEKPAAPTPPTGLWMGTLNIMKIQKLRLVVEIAAPTPGKVIATMDSIDQAANGIPMSTFAADGKTMKWGIKQLNATYEGELKADGKY